jgi:hypothetical protein
MFKQPYSQDMNFLTDTKVSNDTFVQLFGSNASGVIACLAAPTRRAHGNEGQQHGYTDETSHDQLGDTGRQTGF